MTEKDNVSMATVQLKPDYAASEVYSTASEPPPVSKYFIYIYINIYKLDRRYDYYIYIYILVDCV